MLIATTVAVALLGVFITSLLTNYFSRQFSRTKDLAATVAAGNYHLRITEAGPTELRELSHHMNVMAETLEEQLTTRRTLLSNVAHELARPLAGLQLGIESLRKGAIQTPDLADDLLVNMGQTVKRLDNLVEDITLAARPDTYTIVLNRMEVAIGPFLQGVATRFWSLAKSRGIKIKVQVQKDLPPVFADEKRLNQIVGNLIDNAIKFTPHGETIYLSAEQAGEGNIRLIIRDMGKGISTEDAERLFEPFYQGNSGRQIKQGMGLGLSIALQLTKAHGGSLTLENHPKGGTIAILTLPSSNA
jgi:signal transduction histidine kinase